MAHKLTAALPPDFDLPANFIVQLTAVDPTTGALVSGVNVSNVAIMAAPIDPGTADQTALFEPASPLWLPTPL
jgi:hypothetical protein